MRIGDPDVTITGAHEYEIQYTVANGLTQYTQEQVVAIGIAEPRAGRRRGCVGTSFGGEWGGADRSGARVRGKGRADPRLRLTASDLRARESCAKWKLNNPLSSPPHASTPATAAMGILRVPPSHTPAPVEEVIEARRPDRLVLGLLIGFVIAAIAIIVPTINGYRDT